MDLGEILRVMRQRWLLWTPIMVVTGALTVLAYVMLPTTYESTSTVSLLSAERASLINKNGNTNPFLTFDTSLVATADFLSRSMSSKGAQEALKNLGVTEEYTVALADNAQGPFVAIVVTGDDQAHVLTSTQTLTDYAGSELAKIQSANNVKPEDMVRLTTIIPPQKPEAQIKAKLQLVIGVAGAGTALAFMVTFITEGLVRSRTARQSASGRSAPASGAAAPAAASAPAAPEHRDPEKTAIVNIPPSTRLPAPTTARPAPSAEDTQLIISTAARPPATSPSSRRGGSPTGVYRSGTNGKSPDDGK
ncbi:hypothetical protein [Actinoplanes sp. HUAS TT8]|uniref:hypothetical protein n=1 Tax=Actinoplanes sp. HUAS TT8 TaxID=3447453 RepID=UPI003F51E8C4